MFRRAAKEDLKQPDPQNTGLEMAKAKEKGADLRRRILGNRDIVMQSAKVNVAENKEFFSSRKQFGSGMTGVDPKLMKGPIKFQTDSTFRLTTRSNNNARPRRPS